MIPPKPMLILLALTLLTGACNHQIKSSSKEKLKPSVTTNIPEPVQTNNEEAVDISILSDGYRENIMQTFIVPAKKVVEVIARGGLKVTVDPAALESEDGKPVNGDIIVKIAALTNSETMFRANAATVSNGRMLISGGSYFIGLESNGKKLKIKARQSIKTSFPKLAEEEMELFYGKRDADGDMNWERANEPLEFIQQTTKFNPPFPDSVINRPFRSKFYKYGTLEKKVQYMGKIISLKQLAEELQKRGIDKNIDSIQMSVIDFFGRYYHYNICGMRPFDSVKLYGILSCNEIENEKAEIKKTFLLRDYQLSENNKYRKEWEKINYENSIEGQMQKYYAPASVTTLGWINCDRFYDNPLVPETTVELPYTFNGKSLQYFLIYKSFTGLMSGRLIINKKKQYILRDLPKGAPVKMIGFVKLNGEIFQGSQDFVVGENKAVKPEFKNIPEETLRTIFGNNIKM